MGVTGLSSYLTTRHPAAATTVRITRDDATTHTDAAAATGDVKPPPRRLILIDGNGLYHHLIFKFLGSAPRSTGGEWPRFHACIASFFRAFTRLGIAIRVCFDGASSQREGKTGTRNSRANDRLLKMHEFMQRMREVEEANRLPPNCVITVPSAEPLLPVPGHTSLAFHQSCHALGIPCWTSDGENDEHLAALALQLHRESGGRTTVDIMGQDSDFLIFEMATTQGGSDGLLPSASASPDGSSDGNGAAEVGGYVPFESVRYDINDTDAEASLTYKRYTSDAILSALGLPACLLPTLACLIGNDSDLELSHLHTHLRSPGFAKLLAAHGVPFTPTKSFSKNTNSASIEANGGFNTSAQLVESVLAYMQYCRKIGAQAGESEEQLRKAIDRTLGPGASDVNGTAAEDAASSADDGAASPSPSPSPPSTALTLFRDAQLKYSLARFFTPIITATEEGAAAAAPNGAGSSADSLTLVKEGKYGVFDAGFEIVGVEEHQQSNSSSPFAPASTAILLPSPLLSLKHSSLFPSSLLTLLLNREFRAAATLGDVACPCVVHSQLGGECDLTAAESKASESTCLSVDQLTSGLRQRMYQLLFHSMNVEPLPLPLAPKSSTGAQASGESSIAQLTSALSSMATSVKSAVFGSSAASAAAPAPASGRRDRPKSTPPAAAAAPASARARDVVIHEFIHRCPSAFERANFINADDHRHECTVRVSSDPAFTEPLAPATAAADDADSAAWADLLTILSVFDVTPDLGPFLLNRVPKSPSQRRQLLAATLEATCGSGLMLDEIRNMVVVFRTTFLYACRALLSTRFETAPLGCKLESAIQAQLDRAVIGINTIIMQFAITYVRHHVGNSQEDTAPAAAAATAAAADTSSSSSTAAPPTSFLNFDAIGLSQLFGDVYHRFGTLLGLLRCRRAMATNQVVLETLPVIPLPPLFASYTGSVVHRLYTQTIIEIDTQRRTARAAAKAAAAAAGGKPVKKVKVPAVAAASASSSSAAPPSASSPPAASFGIFSLALANTICELDAVIQPVCMQLLASELAPALAITADALFLAIKHAVWSSLGIPSHVAATTPISNPNPAVVFQAILAPLFDAARANTVHAPIIPRPVLPYEVVSSRPLPASSSGSNFFSLCCSPAPMAATDQTGQACAGCGWKPAYLAAQSEQNSNEDEGDEATTDDAAAKNKKKKNRGKKKAPAGRGKR